MSSDAQYPVKPLEEDNDPRFTFGFILEVASVLARQGYPEITSGADYIRLRQVLWSFLYSTKTEHYF